MDEALPEPGRNMRGIVADGVLAGLAAGVLGGAPSTLHSTLSGRDPLESTLAAGSLLLPRERRRLPLLVAAIPVHLSLSACWGLVLAALLPRRGTVPAGAVAGALIAALDLGLAGRRYPLIRALPPAPQLADHIAYGAVAGWVLARRRPGRSGSGPTRPRSGAHPSSPG